MVNVKNINMLIQKRKNDKNLCHFSQFYQGYIMFLIYFQGKSCIQLFFLRKLQYFKFLSWCENIKESCLVLLKYLHARNVPDVTNYCM